MNKYLIFGSGFVIGVLTGVVGVAFYNKKKNLKKENDMNQYEEEISRYARQPHEPHEGEDETVNHEERIEQLREERVERINSTPHEPVNYSAMYLAPSLETEHPKDQGEIGEEEETTSDFDPLDAHNFHQKNKEKPPRLISSEEAGDLPPFVEHEVLFFYSYDEVLVDENDEEIENPEMLTGDCLDKYGFVDNEEKIIFVLNYELTTCYEIQKVRAAFGDRD